MRPDGNPLDLNNFPEEYGKQALEESSTATVVSTDNGGFNKKKRDGKDESGKIYECRFCSLKFCKSQALGGHMNRHRQERETETLNRARELVFNRDSIAGSRAHMWLRDVNLSSSSSSRMQTMPSSCFQQARNINGDSRLNLRSLHARVPAPVSLPQPQHLHSYLYASPAASSPHPFQAPPTAAPPSPTNDYCVGLVLASSISHNQPQNPSYPFFATDGGSWNCGRELAQHATNPSSMDMFRDDI